MADDDESELTVSETADSDGATDSTGDEEGGVADQAPTGQQDGGGADEALKGEENGENSTPEGEPGGESADYDHAAESFVDVERELKGLGEGMRGRGQAVGVDRVPASDVPDDYPVEITTEEALALRLSMVDAENQTVVVYFEWPDQGTDERLARLLAIRDIPVDRFADLHGERILLTVENGYYVPVLPDEEPRGDERAIYGILAGIVPSFLVAAAGILGIGGFISSLPFLALWLIATFVVLPLSVYSDAWHVRTTTDWEGGPLFWAFLSLIPALNVMAVPAYLISRQNAEPII